MFRKINDQKKNGEKNLFRKKCLEKYELRKKS